MSRHKVINITQSGDFSKVNKYLNSMSDGNLTSLLNKIGRDGVDALRQATPKRTGLTANSWYYEVDQTKNGVTITWCNSNVVKDYANVAILIQYGHGTKNGGYVEGIDYINPALKPIFEDFSKTISEVIK